MSLRSKPPTRFARKTILLRLKQPARRASRPRQPIRCYRMAQIGASAGKGLKRNRAP